MKLTRRRALAFAAGTLAFPLSSPAIAQTRRKVVLGQPSEGFIYMALYIARRLDFFAEEKIDAEVVVFQRGGAEALAALMGGQADIYVGNPGLQLRAQEKGMPIRSFGAVQTQFGTDLVISAEAAARVGLDKLKDPQAKAAALTGLTIAVLGPGSLTDLMVRHVARFGGLNPDRDITITPIGSGANMLAAFGQKRIDGYALSAPTSTTGLYRFGGQKLFDFARGEYPPFRDFLFYTLIAREDWITGKAELAQKVVRATWKGLRALKTNPDKAHEAVRTFFPNVPAAEFDAAWSASLPSYPETPRITEVGMRQNYEFLREGEGKPVEVALDRSFTNAVVDAVAPSMI
ncbi:MAG: ABC transporter substrate-binding protein [Bradyrhizobium sp.]|uniref:ABC transporter substrate-binding protein n=1 Tax=Bradyrhizobium sp. TaxID=376 RepID=UPI0029B61CB1|nr:ABC transporter substrate-binding protein [Bradyrhizobium sp.]MDX3968629.1 ABC transporter substrate-binding protein [Bradyrhizobium sp.]